MAQIDSPLGIYDASVYPSPRLDGEAVLLLGNTGLMTAVEIHPGNIPKDTKGCILPETTQSKDFVGNSQADARGAAPSRSAWRSRTWRYGSNLPCGKRVSRGHG